MEIKREDIPDNMINMLEIVGMENFLKIIKEYGGDALYIPYYKSLKKKDQMPYCRISVDSPVLIFALSWRRQASWINMTLRLSACR